MSKSALKSLLEKQNNSADRDQEDEKACCDLVKGHFRNPNPASMAMGEV
jgi:hypothetical protein